MKARGGIPIFVLVDEWREKHLKRDGFVIVCGREVCGWVRELDRPENWIPGCVAVDADGDSWLAVGGDDQRGATRWVMK